LRKLIEGDFFKSIPAAGADGYIIKNVILNGMMNLLQ